MLDHLFKWQKLVLRVLIACFVTSLVYTIALFNSTPAHASDLFMQRIEKQSTFLYEKLYHEKRSQAEIDSALQSQFGLQRMNVDKASSPLTSTNSAINLPASNIYMSHGATFIYSSFSWNCGANCYGDPMDYNDDFGVWFSQNIPIASTFLSVTEVSNVSQTYFNPSSISQGGADYAQNANHWMSGVLETSLDGSFPAGCTEIFTKYAHGWSSNDLTSTSVSAGFPPSFGVSVTYSVTAHSWQATGPLPTRYRC